MGTWLVPEHAEPLMRCLSGGHVHYEDGYMFLAGEDWLMGVGYRQDEQEDDAERFAAACAVMRARVTAEDLFMMAPQLPRAMRTHRIESDQFYVLPAAALVPARLRNVVAKAATTLRVDCTRVFSAAHRRLWAEFLACTPLNARVQRVYAATERLVRDVPNVVLLNAWTQDGQLAACLVLDETMPTAISYVIGAHSRTCTAPHASDVLFAVMLERAQAAGKTQVLLGLGVNEGIARFKRKWGAVLAQPYELAAWSEKRASEHMTSLMQAFLAAPADMSKRQIFASLPTQCPLAMLWRLEKHGRTSWIAGTAHFFCCSFERHLRRVFEHVHTSLFEGPLDPESLDDVARLGQTPEAGTPRVIDFLSENDLASIEKTVNGPFPRLARMFNDKAPHPVDVRGTLRHTRPWYAFFSLWTAYLERHEWTDSVDMDAWNLAMDMGKIVVGMESLAEQIASLESVPVQRIVRFMQDHKQWRKLKNSNENAYLNGDLEKMFGTSAEFPTRTEHVIGVRDQRFRTRMRPYLEAGGVAVFVGSAHMINLRHMLAEDGFTVTRELPTWKHRLRAWWQRDASVVLHPTANVQHEAPPANTSLQRVQAPQHTTSATEPVQHSAAVFATSFANTAEGLAAQARIPEHIAAYVRAMSSTPPTLHFCHGFAAWQYGSSLVLVGYDCDGVAQADFSARLTSATVKACHTPGVERLTVLAPEVPSVAPANAMVHHDMWWGLDIPAAPPQKVRNMIRRAQRDVCITEAGWSAQHKALVELYLRDRTDLLPGTRALFTSLPAYVAVDTACMVSAYTADGVLAGLSVADMSSLRTAFHLFAFRAPNAPPGTADALLDALLHVAHERGHTVCNLGLGVREGIAFFKRKWRARELGAHVESSWNVEDMQS